MVVENKIIEKCLFFIFFYIENCNIDTYFKYIAPYLQAGEKTDKLTISLFLVLHGKLRDEGQD